ncbi:hypothetical protein B0H17DRAFT_1154799 [Mycena rosella]|uniref:Uncharacterized protein n=1 Tax=Mycena rosella TaxID=1033263 RepID=A0AAD7AY12_MYCRO|nr:hypothetical protein B0H17DRAFT_1154799 [Mycena rosella]
MDPPRGSMYWMGIHGGLCFRIRDMICGGLNGLAQIVAIIGPLQHRVMDFGFSFHSSQSVGCYAAAGALKAIDWFLATIALISLVMMLFLYIATYMHILGVFRTATTNMRSGINGTTHQYKLQQRSPYGQLKAETDHEPFRWEEDNGRGGDGRCGHVSGEGF